MSNIRKINYKLIVILLLLLFLVFIYFNDISFFWIEKLKDGSVEDLVIIIRKFGIWAPILSIALMILQAFIAPIPAFLIAGANGVVFGIFFGTIISWIGAMVGATGTFYLARFLGANFVEKMEKNNSLLKKVDEISKQNGMKIIFIGRLLPFISFDFLSYAAGLSSLSFKKFLIATGIGMIPGTIAYVILGNQIVKYTKEVNSILILIALLFVLFWITHTLFKKALKFNKK